MHLSRNPSLVVDGFTLVKDAEELFFAKLSYSRPNGIVALEVVDESAFLKLPSSHRELLDQTDRLVIPRLVLDFKETR